MKRQQVLISAFLLAGLCMFHPELKGQIVVDDTYTP